MRSIWPGVRRGKASACRSGESIDRRIDSVNYAFSFRKWPIPLPLSSVSFDLLRQLVDHCRPSLAHDFVLGIRSSGTTDCADDIALVDERNTASRRNDSIECKQIVEMHKVDTILEDLCWPSEGHGCSRLVLSNLN